MDTDIKRYQHHLLFC